MSFSPYMTIRANNKLLEQPVDKEGYLVVVCATNDKKAKIIPVDNQLFNTQQQAADHIHYLNGGQFGFRELGPDTEEETP